MKLPRTRLVVLSACRTGIESAYRGEGAIGLARPFMVAGVPLVVASLWPVDSEATANLMISFHKHRKQAGNNVPTVDALRLAQLEMIHNSPPNSPPSFGWAAFVAIGGYAAF
jgi:CHAT domain-containing protein